MKSSLKLFLASALLLPALSASALQPAAADLSIDESSLMIEEIAAPGQAAYPARPADIQSRPIITIKRIINLAFKVIAIIEKNRPVVNITTDYANAVPEGITNWTQLTGWQGPSSRTYLFTAKNPAGMQVVKASYKVHYLWGGNYKGKGKFLTGVTIEPVSVETAWGCKLDLTAEVPDSSVGNAGTDEDPVSSMELHLKWKLKTFTQNIEEKAVYRVQGDGLLSAPGPLFSRGAEARAAARLDAATEKIRNSRFY
ncbi:MAG: hypothetical protein Q7R35_04945 [Elusimicrobiota bacterium]|nr:hypothetical protein [Elusimicrobiota bacterium]